MAKSPWTSIPVGVVATIGLSLFPADWASSAPKGFQLKSGNASPPVVQGKELIISSSGYSVIDWSSFSIEREEVLRFAQDSARSCVVNRVRENMPSEILGELLSNGQVYLINPYGIFIGREAYIESAGFIASTLDLFEGDLEQRFKGESFAKLHNEGAIVSKAGYVYLIAHDVENSGCVEAPKVGLLAGADVLIRPDGAPVVRIKSEEGFDPDLLEQNPYALAIRHGGHIRADEVHIAGGDVILASSSSIDVSGDTGGGKAFIGRSATTLFVEEGALVSANALECGDGGEVIFWSDGFTNYHGHTEIRGGPLGGNGGFVEVSGAQLGFYGTVDGLSLGRSGEILLDPTDIIIDNNANANGMFVPVTGADSWQSSAITANIQVSALETALASNNIIVSTATNSGGPFAGAGTIEVNEPISWNSANTLTLLAERNIVVNASVTNAGTGGISFTALGHDNTSSAYSGIEIAAGVTVSATSGALAMSGETNSTAASSHGIHLLGTVSTTTGALTLNGEGGRAASSYGILLAGGSSIAATDGTISLAGTARPMVGVSVSRHIGVVIEDTASVQTSGSGNIFISGSGGSTSGTENHGVELSATGANRPVIQASGSGNITFQNCIAGNSTSSVAGLYLRDAFISANSGDVRVLGCVGANATSSTSLGVWIGAAGGTNTLEISSTSGDVIFDECVGGLNSTTSQGLLIDRASTVTIEADSIIFRNCVGKTASSNSYGWHLTSAPTEINGTSVTIEGTAGPSSSNMFGVRMTTGAITVTTGSMYISGTVVGGAGAGVGLFLSNTLLQGGSGPMNFSGVSYASATRSHGLQFNTTTGIVDFLTTGTVTCFGQGGAGVESMGFWFEKDCRAAGLWVVNAYGGSGASQCYGIHVRGNRELEANSIDITATGGAVGTESHGVYLWGRIQKNGDDANPTTVRGYAPSGASDSHGVEVARGGSVNIGNGRIQAAGSSPITITGVSAGGHGVASVTDETWHVGATTGGVTFLNCQGALYGVSLAGNNFQATNSIVNFVNCSGGTGGVTLSATGTISVPIGIIATNAIVGGSVGFEINATVSLGASGTMTVAATASDTSGTTRGIALTSRGIVGAAGNISLSGTATSSSPSYGIDGVTSAASVTTTSGNITLSGVAQDYGIVLSGTTSVSSASGAITLSGASSSSNSSSRGVQVSNAWSTGTTTANLTFQDCTSEAGNAVSIEQSLTHQGSVIFSDCFSASGIAINWTGTTNVIGTNFVGDLIATNSISGGAGGWASAGTITVNGNIAIQATGSGTSTASHGISMTAGALQIAATGTGSITLNGTGGASSTASHGINVTGGAIVTDSGAVSLTGGASGTAASHGILLAADNAVQSTSGAMTLSGASSSSNSSSRGVQVSNAWSTGTTTANLTFQNCTSAAGIAVSMEQSLTHRGSVIFSDCFSEAGVAINWTGTTNVIGTNFVGDLIATNNISGAGGGWASTGTITVNENVAIKASGSSTTAASHGIAITGGILQIIATGTGSLTLNGTSGPSSIASHGVLLGTASVQTVSGTLSITGESLSSATDSYGVAQNGTITATTGAIVLLGYGGSGANNYGVHCFSGKVISSTDGNISLSGYGRTGGSNGGHIGVRLTASASIETTGAGSILISGSGGNTTGANNHGVQLIGSATGDTVLPTVRATGTGNVTFQDCISGSSTGTNFGAGLFLNDATISSTSGTITFQRCYGPSSGSAVSWGLGLRAQATNATTTVISTTGAIVFDDCAGKTTTGESAGLSISAAGGTGTGARRVEANQILATNVTGAAAPTSIGMYIGDNSVVTAGSGGMTIEASAGPATTNGFGYVQNVASSHLSTTSGGTLSITGMSFGTGNCRGIAYQTANATLQSDTGEIILSGISLGTGTASTGCEITAALNFTTTGTLTFTNCKGGGGAGGIGVHITPANTTLVQTAGPIIATNNIFAGDSVSGNGFRVTGQATGGLRTSAGPILITASGAIGIASVGTIASTGGGDIVLEGIALAPTGNGNRGILVGTGGVQTTGTGNITISGMSASSTAEGVWWSPQFDTGGTTGTLTFTNCYAAGSTGESAELVRGVIHAGDVVFSNCEGGAGIVIGVLSFAPPSTIGGSLIATNNIVARSGNACVITDVTVTGNVEIVATSNATNTVGRGIVVNNTLSTLGASTLSLTGIGGPSSSNSPGIEVLGAVQSASGTITLSGFASGSGVSPGILSVATNWLVSTSGNLILSGQATSGDGSAHGVSISSPVWDTQTSGALTLIHCRANPGAADGVRFNIASMTHQGNLVFSDCTGVVGVEVSGNYSIGGSLMATETIAGLVRGWASNATISVQGNVAIQAEATGSLAAHGIYLSGAMLSVAGASTLTLNGTGGLASSASHGVFFTGGAISSDSGAISVIGFAQGSAVNHGILMETADGIQSASGAITLSGRSDSTGAGSHGVFATTAAWSTLTSATVTFTNCLGGVTSGYGALVGNLTTADDLVFIDCRSRNSGAGVGFVTNPVAVGGALIATNQIIGGGASSSGVVISTDVSIAESAAITALSTSVSGLSAGIYFTAGTFSTTTESIALVGTGGASSGNGSDGINISGGVIESTSGTITLTGIASGGLGSNRGISLSSASNNIISVSAPITLSGVSYASGNNSHGVSVSTDWPAATTATVTLLTCRGGAGTDSHGVMMSGAFSAEGSFVATNNILSGSGSKGFVAGDISSSNTIQITAESLGISGNATGIEVNGVLTTINGSITLIGRGGVSSGVSPGVHFNGGSAVTTGGSVTVTGNAEGSGSSPGILLSATDVITSATGTITLSGASLASGANSHGVSITLPWAAATSAQLTFTSCSGGSGNNSDGVHIAASADLSTGGNLVATNIIHGGISDGSIGWAAEAGIAVSGANTISITALSRGTSGVSTGVFFSGGTVSVETGAMTIVGQGSASSTNNSNGVTINGAILSSTTGSINVTGTAFGSGENKGIWLSGADAIVSMSGTMTLSGVSSSTGDNSHGVLSGSTWVTGTSAPLVFTNCQSGATSSAGVYITDTLDSDIISFTNILGREGGANSRGIAFIGDVTATSITATDTIVGGLSSAGGHGIYTSSSITATVDFNASTAGLGGSHGIFFDGGSAVGGTLTIEGTANGATGSNHGLFISNAAINSMSDPITLTGTGAPSNSASAGVLISGTASVQTDTSAILVTGSGRGNSANPGVQLSASNALTSTSGLITVMGSSVSSNAGSHGVSVVTNGWDAITTGTVTITASTGGILSNGASFEVPFSTGGDVVFSNCEAVNHGSAVYISDAFTVPGVLIATDSIVGTLGPDAKGFTSIGTITVSGDVEITASSTGVTGDCTGVSVATLSGATVTIIGTGGSSDAPSHGVSLTAGSVSTATGTITIDGIASGTAVSYGININGGGVSSTSGTITLTGTSTSTGINAYGVSTLGAFNAVTTAPLTFNGSSTDSFAIRVGGNLSTGGELTFSNDVAIGIDTATTVTITNDGTMSFNSTIDGAYVGINSLTLNAQSGDVFIAGDVGSIHRLASFIIEGNSVEFGANVEEILVNSFEADLPVVFAHQGTITIDTSVTGGNIQFQDTVDGVATLDQDLVLIAGTGAILFGGDVGSNNALGSLEVQSGASVTFGTSASSVDAGSVTIASPVPTVFSSPLTTVTTTGAIFFGGTVDALADDGSQSLTLDAGGAITLAGSVGSTGRFGTLLIDNATQLNMGADASLIRAGMLNVANMVPTILQGTNSALLIEADDVTFSGSVNGDNALGAELTIDATGSVVFGDAIGDMVSLGAFSVVAATDLTLNSGTLNAASISVSAPIPTTLAAATTNLQAITGEIFFGGDILGTSDVTFDAATTVTFLGDIAAGDMTISSATSAIFGPGTHSVNVDTFTIASGISAILQGVGALTINTFVGDIDFGGTIDGQTNAGGHSLTLNSAADNLFAASIGSNVELGALDVATGTSAQFLAGVSSINTTSVSVTPAATFAADSTQITSGNITFSSTVNGTSAGDNSLVITSTGAVTFDDEIGTTARLDNFTITSATSATFGVNSDQIVANQITTGSAVPITLQAASTTMDTSAVGGNILLGAAVDGMGALVLDPGLGNIVLGGAVDVGSVTIPSATDVTATTITAATLTQVSGAGTSTFNGVITLSGDLSLTGTGFAMNNAVSADDAAIHNTGVLAIGSQGDMTLTGGFTQTGAIVQTAGDINAVDAISFGGSVVLTGNVSLNSTSNDVTFNDTLDGTYDLSVTGENVNYLAGVGQTDPLNSISTTATLITVHGSQAVFSGPMSYDGAVVLTTDTAFANAGSNAVHFSSTITGPHTLSIDAPETSVTVDGAIDLSDTPDGHALSISGGAGVILNGAVTTEGVSGFGGLVTIYALNGSIIVMDINSSGATGGGDITMTPSRELNGSGLPAGLIVLRGDLNASPVSNLGGIITLSANRAEQPTVATITSSLGGNDVTITGARVTMGVGEAFTVLGSLDLQSINFTSGDLVALNDLSLAATTIQLSVHGDVLILDNMGMLYISPSLHFLAGDTYMQSGTLIPTGPLNAAEVPLTTDLLTLGTTILNYDQDAEPPPPPTPFNPFPPDVRKYLIYLMDVADAQLSDALPIYWSNFPPDYLQRRREESP